VTVQVEADEAAAAQQAADAATASEERADAVSSETQTDEVVVETREVATLTLSAQAAAAGTQTDVATPQQQQQQSAGERTSMPTILQRKLVLLHCRRLQELCFLLLRLGAHFLLKAQHVACTAHSF
jgi:uncharacterized membrane protein